MRRAIPPRRSAVDKYSWRGT